MKQIICNKCKKIAVEKACISCLEGCLELIDIDLCENCFNELSEIVERWSK